MLSQVFKPNRSYFLSLLTALLPLLLLSGCSIKSNWTPLQLGVISEDTDTKYSEIQLFHSTTKVKGLQLGLFTHNQSLDGVAIALGSEISPGIVGDEISVEEKYKKYYRADNLQMKGFQVSVLESKAISMYGLQISGWRSETYDGYGLQLSGVGSEGNLKGGVQISGLINKSEENFKGVQVALLNVSKNMTGLQIGLLNFNKSGFLPVFPIFNFGWGGNGEEQNE